MSELASWLHQPTLGCTATTPVSTRLLFLDDSGKPDASHPSRAVVLGGLSIPSVHVPSLARRLLGAKARFFPNRGHPSEWELKSHQIVKPNPWRRSKNRRFVAEVLRIIDGLDCTVYTAGIDKSRLKHSMALGTALPLQAQVLAEHFSVECDLENSIGIVVVDRSSHHLDAHTSSSVASFIATNKLPLHRGLYFAASHTSEPLQVADLLSGVRRRCIEGDQSLADVAMAMTGVCNVTTHADATTHAGRSFRNEILLLR